MPALTITDLNNAKQDVDHLAAIATSQASFAVDRLGQTKRTLKGLEDEFPNASVFAGEAAASADAAADAESGAEAAATQAQLARDAAQVFAAVYPTIAAGRAAVADGAYFKVAPAGSDALARLTLFQRTNSAAQTVITDYVPGTEYDLAVHSLWSLAGATAALRRATLFRDALPGVLWALFDKARRAVLTISPAGDMALGGRVTGRSFRAIGSIAGRRDAFATPLQPVITTLPDGSGQRKVLLQVDAAGRLLFLPAPGLAERLAAATDWRGTVPSFGIRRAAGDLTIAAVQDQDGRVYDAAQRSAGSLPTFVCRDTRPLLFHQVMGQSNAGAPNGYEDSYAEIPYPGHVLMFPAAGDGKFNQGFAAQSPTVLQDFEACSDVTLPTNNFVATLAGHAAEYAHRRLGHVSQGQVINTAFTGGKQIDWFLPGGSFQFANAMQARQRAVAVAALYGRTVVDPWITYIQGESGEGGRAGYAASLNTLIDALRPAAKTAMGQADLPIFAMVQTNAGDQPDPEPGLSQMDEGAMARVDVVNARFSEGVRLIGPMYQCPLLAAPDNIHTQFRGRCLLGEMVADARDQELFHGVQWKPLQPNAAVLAGNVITITYDVPAGALAWDTDWVKTIANKGFFFADAASGNTGSVAITAVAITGPATVQITLASAPSGPNPRIQYAYGGAKDAVYDFWSSARGQLMSPTTRRSYFFTRGVAIPEFIRHYSIKFELEL